MSIFGNIMNKIFHHNAANAAQPSSTAPQQVPQGGGQADTSTITAPAPAPAQQVDVGAVLSEMAASKGGGGNYQSSLVVLL